MMHYIIIQLADRRIENGSQYPAYESPSETSIFLGSLERTALGGASRNRTDMDGFAIRCMTILPSRPEPQNNIAAEQKLCRPLHNHSATPP
jgi:hypothetical protein